MRFKQAVESTPGLEQAYRSGLQALQRSHHDRVSCDCPRAITGSVDIDGALTSAKPTAARWDYAVGLEAEGASEKVFWIEVHPASSQHVSEVLQKLAWLKGWLRAEAPQLGAFPHEFVWLASGRVSIQPHNPQSRKIAAQGLSLKGHLELR